MYVVTKWFEGWRLREEAETSCEQTEPQEAAAAWDAFHAWLDANPLFTPEILCAPYPQVPIRIWFR